MKMKKCRYRIEVTEMRIAFQHPHIHMRARGRLRQGTILCISRPLMLPKYALRS